MRLFDAPSRTVRLTWRSGLLASILLALLLAGLGRAPLFDVDEGAFSEATREMIYTGDWGHTTLNGADRFDKPIGVYWLQATSASVLGLNEFALRLPSALSTWLASLALGIFVAARWGGRAGGVAAVVHATSFGSWAMAHAATADALLGLWLVLSALDLWRFLESDDRAALRRLGAWVGLGLLVKGPVAVLLPLSALLLSCVFSRDMTPFRRALGDLRTWLWMLGLSVPWYAYALWRHGQAFIDGFLLKHNIDRFAAPMEGHSGSWLYFLIVAPLLWLPWSPLLWAWWGRWQVLWQDSRTRNALIWAGFVLVFFTLSGTKLPHYGLYAAPGVVVLLASASTHARRGLWLVCALCLVLWQALMLGLPVALLHDAFAARLPQVLKLALASTSARINLGLVVGLWGALWVSLLAWRLLRQDLRASAVLSAMALCHALVLTWVVWPWWAQTLQGPIKVLAHGVRDRKDVVVQSGGNWPSFAFYRQELIQLRSPLAGDMVLMTKAEWMEQHPDWPLVRVERNMVLVQCTPKKDLQK